MQTRTSTLKLIKLSIIILFALAIIFYAAWRSKDYVKGPSLEVYEPSSGSSIAANTIIVEGKATRANTLLLNGNSISLDEQGNWRETLIIFPGINYITIEATDRFGKTIKRVLTVLGENLATENTQENPEENSVSTSSPEII